jgi:hypothetical protein
LDDSFTNSSGHPVDNLLDKHEAFSKVSSHRFSMTFLFFLGSTLAKDVAKVFKVFFSWVFAHLGFTKLKLLIQCQSGHTNHEDVSVYSSAKTNSYVFI